MTGTALVRRDSIEELIGHRNRAVELFGQARDLLSSATEAAGRASPSTTYSISPVPRDMPNRDEWRATVDRAVWNHLIYSTGMEALMDHTARQQFRNQLEAEPPEVTVDNCFATIHTLLGSADQIFRRGIAEVFSKLDRRFRTHDGFKFGNKVILTNAVNNFGSWNHYRHTNELLRDVERTFHILDGKPVPEYTGSFVAKVSGAMRWDDIACVVEDDYFKARVFQNCNMHLWFKRADLVEKVNKMLAAHYGAAIASGAAGEGTFTPREGVHAKNFGFFPTPPDVVERVMRQHMWRREGMTVLEPSAGRGSLALPLAKDGYAVTCVEIQPDLAKELEDAECFKKVICDDFLRQVPEVLGTFDRIVMNPPFDKGLDVDHVTHAVRFLKPDGHLIAIMSAGAEFREDKRTQRFRDMARKMKGEFFDLPAGSFKESGTNVNTCIVVLKKKADK